MTIGLVLAGGGGKGAYQVGVMRALAELNIAEHIEAVAGTSVGALNAALFVNQNWSIAEQMWRTISPNKILSLKGDKLASRFANVLTPSQMQRATAYPKKLEGFGFFSREGLLSMIAESIDLSVISAASMPFFVTCTAIERWEASYFQMNGLPQEKMAQILLATSAIPGVFSNVTIDGESFIDGGFVDNVPVKPLYDLGCDTIIAVLLDRAATVRKEDFPNARIVEIVPQRAQGNALTGTLNFDGIRAHIRMKEGYADALAVLQPVANMLRQEQHFFQTAKQIVKGDQSFQTKHQHKQAQFRQSIEALTQLMEGDD